MPETPDTLSVGDVISIAENEQLGVSWDGEYVIEEAMDRGGWFIIARRLNDDGSFSLINEVIYFHQCPGYKNSITSSKIVRRMTRIFV